MYQKRMQERRVCSTRTSFPMITRGGCLVTEERRCRPDRRLGNIVVEMLELEDGRFPEYFSRPE